MKQTLFLSLLVLTVLSACETAPPPPTALTDVPSNPAATEIPAPGETHAASLTTSPADSPTDNPTASLTASLTDIPTLEAGSSQISPVDGMLLLFVPGGDFAMGSEGGYSDERPVHTVELPALWVDQTEVTNSKYALCVEADVCARPRRKSSNLIDNYFGFEEYGDYPVIFISWQDAFNYCTWAGRRLPTEAEWEKAARGTDGREYPWGAALPNNTLANFDHYLKDVTRVGNYPDGASPYGAFDMAGNVLEWTADWYGEDYYTTSPSFDPPGAESGTYRVVRGGSWTGNASGVRSAHRFLHKPDEPFFDIGFRCVMDPLP